MEKLDLMLLDKVAQPATDFVCDLTGKNCFRQAIVLWHGYILSFMLYVASSFSVSRGIILFGLILFCLLNSEVLLQEEKFLLKNPGLMNRRRQWTFGRVLVIAALLFFVPSILLMGITSFRDLYFLVWMVFAIVVPYVEACTPRPPRPLSLTTRSPIWSSS